MREDQTQHQNPNSQSKPPQFGLRAIFVVTAMVAMVAAGARFGCFAGAFAAVSAVALVVTNWASRTGRDRVSRVGTWVLATSFTLMLLAVGDSQIRGVKKEALHNVCKNNLKDIAVAVSKYRNKHGRFPPAVIYDFSGKPMHSWRTLILPYLEEGSLFAEYRFDEPWDSLHNKEVTYVQVMVFQCAASERVGPCDTNYVALIAPGSIWSGEQGAKLDELTDGDKHTLIIIELKNSGIHWAEPRDLDLDNLPQGFDKNHLGKSLSPHVKGIVAVYADGHVETIPSNSSIEELKAAVSKSDGKMADFEKYENRVVPIPIEAKP
jgi:hypothetical protein